VHITFQELKSAILNYRNMHFKRLFIVLLFLPIMGCAQSKVESATYNTMLSQLLSHSVKEISVSDPSFSTTSYIFLDAREKVEYNISHLKKAIWVGFDDFNLDRVKEINKTKPIVVYCSVGYRSEKIAEKLIKAGFTNVQNLYGGIFEWKNQDKSVVNTSGQPTDKVHAYNKTWGIWLKKGTKVYK
jgi:rhodanese-related sulfurtransferase